MLSPTLETRWHLHRSSEQSGLLEPICVVLQLCRPNVDAATSIASWPQHNTIDTQAQRTTSAESLAGQGKSIILVLQNPYCSGA